MRGLHIILWTVFWLGTAVVAVAVFRFMDGTVKPWLQADALRRSTKRD